MKSFFAAMGILAALAVTALPARANEATFERDLTVSGRVDLTVQTGSGSIQLTPGPAGHVHIFGRVKSNWLGNGGNADEIAAHPPIEQTGNIVRVGGHGERLINVSIDYEIQGPADAFLHASSGSGSIRDDGVGEDAKLSNGSGSIRATGLHGGFTLNTGSGSIYAEQAGEGNVKADTGSGSIELRDVRGSLTAQTGSGSIKVGGTPIAPWRLQTGSGSVELWIGPAAVTLDASTGSGRIHTDQAMMTQGSPNRHRVEGKINGGGPTVLVKTGSGSVRVH